MAWYENLKDDSPIISCRLRLARNLRKYPFLFKLDETQAREMIKDVTNAIMEKTNNFEFIDVHKKTTIEKLTLLDYHKISHDLVRSKRPSALISSKDDFIHVMLNEEDHIRIQSIYTGNNIEKAYELANYTDNLIEESIEYAFHETYGYLTSCPSNTGTGMRASYMLHLPMLDSLRGRMEHLTRSLASLGMTVRGLHGEHSSSEGSIFQVSNQITLGRSEEDLLKNLQKTVNQLVKTELEELEKRKNKSSFEDSVYRAYGTLKYVRAIDIREARSLLSKVKIGILAGVLKEEIKTPIYNIMMNVDYGALKVNYLDHIGNFENAEHDEINALRASYIRESL
ncbi:MAG: ATP--guanido phosphotransferase [Defluviitaleaceae bacterium]|nr:ATP--guanido phosphotransferase [Defluviitaleaceae bacterium]